MNQNAKRPCLLVLFGFDPDPSASVRNRKRRARTLATSPLTNFALATEKFGDAIFAGQTTLSLNNFSVLDQHQSWKRRNVE